MSDNFTDWCYLIGFLVQPGRTVTGYFGNEIHERWQKAINYKGLLNPERDLAGRSIQPINGIYGPVFALWSRNGILHSFNNKKNARQ